MDLTVDGRCGIFMMSFGYVLILDGWVDRLWCILILASLIFEQQEEYYLMNCCVVLSILR